jgi:hypothetical protein
VWLLDPAAASTAVRANDNTSIIDDDLVGGPHKRRTASGSLARWAATHGGTIGDGEDDGST